MATPARERRYERSRRNRIEDRGKNGIGAARPQTRWDRLCGHYSDILPLQPTAPWETMAVPDTVELMALFRQIQLEHNQRATDRRLGCPRNKHYRRKSRLLEKAAAPQEPLSDKLTWSRNNFRLNEYDRDIVNARMPIPELKDDDSCYLILRPLPGECPQ